MRLEELSQLQHFGMVLSKIKKDTVVVWRTVKTQGRDLLKPLFRITASKESDFILYAYQYQRKERSVKIYLSREGL